METGSPTPHILPFIAKGFAEELMAGEAVALREMKQFTLKFYEWERESVTFGHFIKPNEHLVEEELIRLGIDCARRPTGGGIIFHFADVSFSLLIPKGHPLYRENTLESYRVVNALVGRALHAVFGEEAAFCQGEAQGGAFCMARPTIYDILLFGKKIGGAAQRRGQGGVLHQGSVQLRMPGEQILRRVLKNPESLLAMRENYVSIEGDLQGLRHEIQKCLSKTVVV